MNSFEVLGIPVGTPADSDTTKGAWRRLSLQYHPDKNNGSKIAEWFFKRVQIAFAQIKSGIGRDTIEPLLEPFPPEPQTPISGPGAGALAATASMPPEPQLAEADPPDPADAVEETEPEWVNVSAHQRRARGRYNVNSERVSNKRPWAYCIHPGCTTRTQWTYCMRHRRDLAGDVFG